MASETLSIALCTYNGAQYLPEQLDSIAAQTRPPDELVVCDDGSADGTLQIIERFAERVPFPVHLHVSEHNLGSTKNFERAIGLCRGNIIALADQDDVWRPEKLARIMAAFTDNPRAGLVFSDAEMVDENLKPLGRRMWRSLGFTRREQESFRRGRGFGVLLRRSVIFGMAMAFRAKHRDKVLPIPTVCGHDVWIALILAAVAETALIDEPLVLYRQHPANQMGGIRKSLLRPKKRKHPAGDLLERYMAGSDRFQHARKRLMALADGMDVAPETVSVLEAKLRHLDARATMARCPNRWWRLALGLGELGMLRYHRYSNGGFRKFAKDMLRPTVQ
jgi:glycosyltransferase involved in cell wall biosynthesis